MLRVQRVFTSKVLNTGKRNSLKPIYKTQTIWQRLWCFVETRSRNKEKSATLKKIAMLRMQKAEIYLFI